MQELEGSSPDARDALLALSEDLRLPYHDVIKALEYAWDNRSSHTSAAEALDFGFIMTGCFVDIRVLNMALQKLRRNFGSQCCGWYRLETGLMFQGILVVPTAQHVSLQQWSAQPSAWAGGQSRSAANTPAQHVSLQKWSAQPSAWSGGRPLQSALTVPTQPTITTVPGSSQRMFNPNSNSSISYQYTAAWLGSSQRLFNPNFSDGRQRTSTSDSSLSGSWPTSQQTHSTSGTNVTGSPNVANNPTEYQFTGDSTTRGPLHPHKSHRSDH